MLNCFLIIITIYKFTNLPPSVFAKVKNVFAKNSTKIEIKATLILECAEGNLSLNNMSSSNDIDIEAALEMLNMAVIWA